jgi:hypothetical protein
LSLLPDWNSIESAARWSEGLFWAGIVALAVVAFTEIAAHIYSNRAAYLIAEHARVESELRQQQERETELSHSAEAAKIQRQLDTANAELRQLQPKTTGRHLSDQQKTALVRALRSFGGQKIRVWCSPNASDSVALGREFIAVLKQAGWNVPDNVLTGHVAGGDMAGIYVAYEGVLSDPSEIPPGIDTLVTTLERLGLVSDQTVYIDDTAHGGEFLLKIGRMPAK